MGPHAEAPWCMCPLCGGGFSIVPLPVTTQGHMHLSTPPPPRPPLVKPHWKRKAAPAAEGAAARRVGGERVHVMGPPQPEALLSKHQLFGLT